MAELIALQKYLAASKSTPSMGSKAWTLRIIPASKQLLQTKEKSRWVVESQNSKESICERKQKLWSAVLREGKKASSLIFGMKDRRWSGTDAPCLD